MGKWFICHNESVTGPFNEDEIRAKFDGNTVPADSLIWGKGAGEWRPFSSWVRGVGAESASFSQPAVESVQLWHYAIDGVSKGPLNRKELIFELKNVHDKGEILVWTKGMKAWADLYEFHDLIDELGLNRREHPRVRVSGSVAIKTDDASVSGDLHMVSSGGFGALGFPANIAIGATVSAELTIAGMNEPVPAKAVVQYVTDAGYHGFKFQNLNMEAKSRLMDFVRTAKSADRPAA